MVMQHPNWVMNGPFTHNQDAKARAFAQPIPRASEMAAEVGYEKAAVRRPPGLFNSYPTYDQKNTTTIFPTIIPDSSLYFIRLWAGTTYRQQSY